MNTPTSITMMAFALIFAATIAGCSGADDPAEPPASTPAPAEGFLSVPPVSISMPATFTMGSDEEIDETPHQVTLTRRFFMQSTEVTNAQYVAAVQWAYDQGHVTESGGRVIDALDGSTANLLNWSSDHSQIGFNGGVFHTSHPDRPVLEVSWHGAAAYCDWLSMQEGLARAYDHRTWTCRDDDPYSCPGYRLPTEAEWEFACRAGTSTHFNTGACLDSGTEANYAGRSPYLDCPAGPYLGSTTDAGTYPPNPWGLLDMHGNVYEWCHDWYGDYSGDEIDPKGPEAGSARVLRGGGWGSTANSSRSARREMHDPRIQAEAYGFRPVRSAI